MKIFHVNGEDADGGDLSFFVKADDFAEAVEHWQTYVRVEMQMPLASVHWSSVFDVSDQMKAKRGVIPWLKLKSVKNGDAV